MSIPTLPKGTVLLENQVAGHTFQDSAEAIGMLRSSSGGSVFKPLTKPLCAEREREFYERINAPDAPAHLATLRRFTPDFLGTQTLFIRNKNVEFLKLVDLTIGIAEPCVIDVKIGRRTWDPLATEEKRIVEESKYVRCKEHLGFCIPGLQAWSIAAGKVKRYGKEYGKSLDETNVKEAFKIFLNADVRLWRPLVQRIHAGLVEIQTWAREQRVLKLYSSSVLMVYDAKRLRQAIYAPNKTGSGDFTRDLPLDDLISTHGENKEWIQVKMIDFAHAFPNEDGGPDSNYVFGIDSLVRIFEEFLEQCS